MLPGDPVVRHDQHPPLCSVDAPLRISSITILMHGTKLELDGYAWLIGADRKSEELFIGSR
jgi:hypothetical protein